MVDMKNKYGFAFKVPGTKKKGTTGFMFFPSEFIRNMQERSMINSGYKTRKLKRKVKMV